MGLDYVRDFGVYPVFRSASVVRGGDVPDPVVDPGYLDAHASLTDVRRGE